LTDKGLAAFMAAAPVAALKSRYDEPWRHYHAWAHPQAMLRHLNRAIDDGVETIDPIAAAGFVLWHDAIYDPQAPHGRNEMLSANLCRAEMAAIADATSIDRACVAIEATIGHALPERDCPDAALLLDIDLSILGADPDGFAAYDQAIRAEYAHVAEADYRKGRAAILRRFVERDRLYLTDWGFARWETQASANISAAIGRLS
jgi:predicted metal-dependent HD superfamily phosphohydrolase